MCYNDCIELMKGNTIMGRNKKYGTIVLTAKSRSELEKLANSLTAEYRKLRISNSAIV